MKTILPRSFFVLAIIILHIPGLIFAQGTVFTYQGRLDAATGPASGTFDFTFSVATNASGGTVLGTLTNSGVFVTNGLFTTIVELGGIPDGKPYWLELGVRTNGRRISRRSRRVSNFCPRPTRCLRTRRAISSAASPPRTSPATCLRRRLADNSR